MVATVTYQLETIEDNFQANSWTGGSQFYPDVLGLSNGGYVVAYNNFSTTTGQIFLEFYSPDGTSTGYKKPYDSNYSQTANGPTLTQLSNGNVLVVWEENEVGAGGPGIAGAIFTDTGTLVVPEFMLTTETAHTKPQVTALTGGEFVVTYQFGQSLFVEVFDANGNSISNELLVDTTVGGNSEPVVTGLADGGFAVTWTHDAGAYLELRARLFEADGTPREVNGSTSDFLVAAGGNNSQPAVAALPNGNWAIAYTDSGWLDEDVGITLTIMGPDGEIVVPFIHVNVQSSQNELDPDIAVLDNGFIVVSWTYPDDPDVDEDIHCRIFDQNGNPITVDGFGAEIVLADTAVRKIKSAVSDILAGQFVAGWQDLDGDGSGTQITATVRELVRTTTGDGSSETLTGDALRDIMFGNGSDDLLNGGGGADDMQGGGGNDTYIVGTAGDTVTEAANAGTDLVQSAASFTLGANVESLTLTGGAVGGTGNSSANIIIGNSAANTLDGKGDADNMQGGTGNDTYVVNNAGDTVTEAANAGTDLVQSSASHTLGSNVENLTLTGGAVNGTGNTLVNKIIGNSAANTLDGKGDADTMQGGGGNDTYVLNNAGDTVTEAANAGTDLVQSSVSFTLAVNVEHLTLTGGAANGTGNSSANKIIGNTAANKLNGSTGNDILTGAAAADAFLFNTTLNAATNLDHITDFATEDTIQLENAVFSALTTTGTLAAGAFHSAAGATTAHDLDDRIVYNTTTGALFYDADGNLAGGVAAVQFADLDNNAALTAADLFVV